MPCEWQSSCYPGEELAKSALLVCYDQLSDSPKSGLSFEILQDITQHTEHVPCFQDSQAWLIMVSLHAQKTPSKSRFDTAKQFEARLFLASLGIFDLAPWVCTLVQSKGFFLCMTPASFKYPALDKACWKRRCSGMLCFFLAQYVVVSFA